MSRPIIKVVEYELKCDCHKRWEENTTDQCCGFCENYLDTTGKTREVEKEIDDDEYITHLEQKQNQFLEIVEKVLKEHKPISDGDYHSEQIGCADCHVFDKYGNWKQTESFNEHLIQEIKKEMEKWI